MKKNNNIIKTVITILVVITITSFVYDYLIRKKEHAYVYGGYEGFEDSKNDKDDTKKDKSCSKDTPIDPMKSYAATISFWKNSQLEGEPLKYEFYKKEIDVNGKKMSIPISKKGDILVEDVLSKVKPVQTLTFTWEDPAECFAWIREVAGSSGEKRLNVASDFEITNKVDGSHELSFTQNAGKCCDEFVDKDSGVEKEGTRKTFNSKTLTVDESTCQQDDCLWVGLTSIKFPPFEDQFKCDDAKLCSL